MGRDASQEAVQFDQIFSCDEEVTERFRIPRATRSRAPPNTGEGIRRGEVGLLTSSATQKNRQALCSTCRSLFN
jgi:hypothetical protein